MATFSPIPATEKQIGATAVGRYAVFVKSLLTASTVASKLAQLDNKDGIPAHGYITFKKKKVYYCRYGVVNDESIYSK